MYTGGKVHADQSLNAQRGTDMNSCENIQVKADTDVADNTQKCVARQAVRQVSRASGLLGIGTWS